MSDHRLDGGAPSELAFDAAEDPAQRSFSVASVDDILKVVGKKDRRDLRYCHLAFAIRTDFHGRHYGTSKLGAHDVPFA
jgi:hypothetical protein